MTEPDFIVCAPFFVYTQNMISHNKPALDTSLPRCIWASNPDKAFYMAYHDHEWGVPVHDDRLLFEMLILEGAQAGLSWETVLKKSLAVLISIFGHL
jgi:hypothetical protein